MSKIYNTYLSLKKENPETIYLFKSGIFFIAIDTDATLLSSLYNFKITNLTDKIVKCGFPCSSYEKYFKMFSSRNLNFKVIDYNKNTQYTPENYVQNDTILELLDLINNVDLNNLSITEMYNFIENLKAKVTDYQNT